MLLVAIILIISFSPPTEQKQYKDDYDDYYNYDYDSYENYNDYSVKPVNYGTENSHNSKMKMKQSTTKDNLANTAFKKS